MARPPQPTLSVAPMMQRSDRHFRFLIRIMSRRTVVFTEMLTARAVLHGRAERLLAFDPSEHPIILQLGGDDPRELAQATARAYEHGFDGVNLNVGCPSDRVQSGNFGAALMLRPDRVADCVSAMQAASPLPVSVKHRTGVDAQDDEQFLHAFVATVRAAGCREFQVHARKAWLSGLSPRENREIPPLDHARVHRLRRAFPDLSIVTNGGIGSLQAALEQLEHVHGVMIGRAAWEQPFLFARADSVVFSQPDPVGSRSEVVVAMLPYVARELTLGTGKVALLRNLFNLFVAQKGSRRWKQALNRACQIDPPRVVPTIEAALSEIEALRADVDCAPRI